MNPWYFHEVTTDSSFLLYVNRNPVTMEENLKETVEKFQPFVETIVTGMVRADTVSEALNKVRLGEWDQWNNRG